MRMQPTLESGRRMDQKQFAKSRTARQAEGGAVEGVCKMAPIWRRVGSRNLGGGTGQLAFKATMLIMSAALEADLRLTKHSALGRPGCRAMRPAWRRASNIDWTRGQFEGFCGGVRASARSRPPGARGSQISGGMGTEPARPMPLAARAGEMGPGSRDVGEVSEVWWSGRECASMCKRCKVVKRRASSSAKARRDPRWAQPPAVASQSERRALTMGVGEWRREASWRAAPWRCIRDGRWQVGQGRWSKEESGQR